MRCRRDIRIAAFIVSLAAWPTAIHHVHRYMPLDSETALLLVTASLIFYIGCAIVFRSRVITGMLVGIVIWVLNSPAIDPDHHQRNHVVENLIIYTVAGIAAGALWELIKSIRRPPPVLPSGNPDPN